MSDLTFLLLRLDLTNAPAGNVVRVCNAPYDIELNGDTYSATGDLLSVGDGANYEAELVSTGVTISLSGIDPSYQQEIDNNGFLRAPIDLILAKVPEGSNVATSSSYYHRGFADTPQTIIDNTNGTIQIQIETTSLMGDLNKTPNLTKTSYASHSTRHQGDKFFEFCADADTEEVWTT